MYPNVYCKRQYDTRYANTMPETGNLTFMVPTQKLQPSAAPFEPKKASQLPPQQPNELANEQQTEPKEEVEVQAKNNFETSDIIEKTNDQTLQYGNMPVELPKTPNDDDDALLEQKMQIVPTDTNNLMPQIQAVSPRTNEALLNSYHPLQHIWTLWYLETDRSKTWEEMQNEISSVNSVEDFWRLYNHIKPASEIKAGCDYSLFKYGIRPMWEDEANRNGGRWVINLPRMLPNEDLDNIWLDVLLCLIGETFEHTDQLCGAVINVRNRNNKISIWTRDGDNSNAILEIGSRLRWLLNLAPQQMHYQLHKDTMAKTNGSVRSIYVL